MKRILVIVLCMLLVLGAASGCGTKKSDTVSDSEKATTTEAKSDSQVEGTEDAEKEPEPVTIVLGLAPADSDEAGLKAFNSAVEEFTKEYPWITVKSENFVYDPGTFIPKAESGQLPNIFNTWYTEPQKLINAGYVAEITEQMKAIGWDKLIHKNSLDLASKDGKIYGIPTNIYSLGLMINADLFAKAGLVDERGVPLFPKTFDEVREYAKIIKEKTGKYGYCVATRDHQGGWHFTNIAWNYGVEFEKQVNGKWVAAFNSPEGVEALKLIYDMKWVDKSVQDSALVGVGDWIKLFGTGQVAMVPGDSAWAPTVVATDYKMNKDHIALCSFPAGPKNNYALMGGNLFMFSKDSTPAQIDACLKFLKFVGQGPEFDPNSVPLLEQAYQELRNADPPRPITKGFSVSIDPELLRVHEELFNKYVNVNIEFFNDYYLNNFKNLRPEEPYHAQDLYGILDSVLQRVLTDKNVNLQELLDKAAHDFQVNFLDKIN
ncbi:MAG TPA: extracellular solute-binding protein [Clostridiaceae bacterium]|nr:extracellular solute-binding protein [Clostridiaceae bacterium]